MKKNKFAALSGIILIGIELPAYSQSQEKKPKDLIKGSWIGVMPEGIVWKFKTPN